MAVNSQSPAADSAPVVPAGTIIPMELKNTINSRTAYVEQAVYCETTYPIALNDHILIPAQSYAKGAVTAVARPGHVRAKAQLGLRFDSITLPSGITRPISARVFSIGGARLEEEPKSGEEVKQPEGEAAGSNETEDAVIDATGLATGSPLSAASQGVGGLILMLATRGRSILLRPGTTLEIQLTAPLDLTPRAARNDSTNKKAPRLSHRP